MSLCSTSLIQLLIFIKVNQDPRAQRRNRNWWWRRKVKITVWLKKSSPPHWKPREMISQKRSHWRDIIHKTHNMHICQWPSVRISMESWETEELYAHRHSGAPCPSLTQGPLFRTETRWPKLYGLKGVSSLMVFPGGVLVWLVIILTALTWMSPSSVVVANSSLSREGGTVLLNWFLWVQYTTVWKLFLHYSVYCRYFQSCKIFFTMSLKGLAWSLCVYQKEKKLIWINIQIVRTTFVTQHDCLFMPCPFTLYKLLFYDAQCMFVKHQVDS